MRPSGSVRVTRSSICCISYLFITHFFGSSNEYIHRIFNLDGRVLQVEYASAAASHSSCVVVAPIPNDNSDDNDNTVIILTTRPVRTVQERLVVLTDSHTVVALSGILTDSLALLQKVQDETLNNRRWYGRGLACHQVSETIRSACQRHAFGGGLRPYGSTIVVCGVLEGGHIQTQRTDPSGSLQDIDIVRGLQVVGGPADGVLRKEIMRQQQSKSWQPKDVAQGIVQMTRQILEADRKERAIKSSKAGATNEDPIVEVVVVSATRGVYKLSPSQLRALLDKAETA
jgi:20S proteasome alpha/beta subunit